MKDSMRKKPKNATEDADETPSASGDSANPWANETSKEPDTTLSQQTSKVSNGTTETKSGTDAGTSETSPSTPRAEVAATTGDDNQSSSKPARRRKTVTDSPHTFTLAEDLKPPKKSKKSKTSSTDPEPTTSTLPIHSSPISNGHNDSTPSVIEQLEKVQSPSRKANNPFAPSSHTRKSSSYTNGSTNTGISNPCRFTPPQLNHDTFFGKVIVITHGDSPVGQSIVRKLHAVGSRVIFGDTNPDRAKRFISSLGPPDIIHSNPCEPRNYNDILELFKLAVSMYGRVDHAIFGIGDDGGQAASVGQGEKGVFEDPRKTGKDAIAAVQTEGSRGYEDFFGASIRFARIALTYLQHTPNPAKNASKEKKSASADRSLTFITSVAAFKSIPGLPIYQATQHATLGLVRSLSSSIDPEKDGVRINAVATNMMIPRTTEAARGRMSVIIPPDNPEDIGRLVAGVVAGSTNEEGGFKKTGIWYEDSRGRLAESYLHGRLLFTSSGECWDIQEGIDRSEFAWFGGKPSDAVANSLDGVGTGKNWILDVL